MKRNYRKSTLRQYYTKHNTSIHQRITHKSFSQHISCISQSFLNKVFVTKIHLQKSHIYSILGVGQTRIRILGQTNLAIQINGKCFKFDFHVIDNLPHSLIIGIYFLKANNVSLNLSQNTMNLSDNEVKMCM